MSSLQMSLRQLLDPVNLMLISVGKYTSPRLIDSWQEVFRWPRWQMAFQRVWAELWSTKQVTAVHTMLTSNGIPTRLRRPFSLQNRV
jgi:hypothetical protein